jgi:nucleoid-associated protein YgaU
MALGLRDKYAAAIQTAKGLHMDGSADERDGKLYFKGTVKSEDEKNRIWTAIKTIPSYQAEIVADIKVVAPPPGSAPRAAAAAARTYTVKSGDTLSKIAKSELGDAQAYGRIFEANRDQLSDPDKIRPGQVLKIPS